MTLGGAPAPSGAGWRGFALAFAAAALALLAGLYGFVVALDPFGRRTSPTRPPTAIMDVNQRYMYPQLARSGLYDAAIFGTSTVRLLDPARLGAALGARVVNLAINAGTPWEQLQLARLFLRHVPRPRLVVMGLDLTWCDPAADHLDRETTRRTFPAWLFDDDPLDDLPELLNLRSLEIAARVALHAFGLMPARIRPDGYEVFTPPEETYDPVRARALIRGPLPPDIPSLSSNAVPADSPARYPALDWLQALVADLPSETRLVLLLPPVHVAAQTVPGSPDAALEGTCKARIATLAAGRPRTVAIDFRFPSGLTTTDANYWDPLHYRLPIAQRLADEIAAIVRGDAPQAGKDYRVLSSPGWPLNPLRAPSLP